MPALPLPLGSSLLGGDLDVASYADIQAVMPLLLQPDDPAPVRDALFNALLAILTTYQKRTAFAVAQSDLLNAVGLPLQQCAADLGVFKQPGETDDQLRARALLAPSLVTPQAVIAAANTLLAPFTSVSAAYYESLGDRWIVRSAGTTTGPRAYLYKRATSSRSPDYPDRLYASEAAQNGGVGVPNRDPGGARVFSDRIGRYFVLRVPDISSLNNQMVSAMQETTPSPTQAMYIGSGISATNTSFIRELATTALTVYGQIVNVVTRIKGASVRWMLSVETSLPTV